MDLLSTGGTGVGAASGGTARGIVLKAKQDQEFKDRPLELNAAYREGEHWRPKDLKVKGLLQFKGFKAFVPMRLAAPQRVETGTRTCPCFMQKLPHAS